MADQRDKNPGAGEQTGEGVGGIGGTLAGAGLGSLAGPVGTIVGGIAGAVGGWWAGEKAGRALEDSGDHEDEYRRDYEKRRESNVDYDTARVGYVVGYTASMNPTYTAGGFDSVDTDLRRGWRDDRVTYESVRPYVERGYEYGRTRNREGSTGGR